MREEQYTVTYCTVCSLRRPGQQKKFVEVVCSEPARIAQASALTVGIYTVTVKNYFAKDFFRRSATDFLIIFNTLTIV